MASNDNKMDLILGTQFDMNELGAVKFMLGMLVSHDLNAHTISISQPGLIAKILEDFKMTNCHPVPTPLNKNVIISPKLSPSTPTAKAKMACISYHQLIGSLMYLAVGMRPNIAHAVQHLSQFCANPGMAHWTAAKHVM